MIDKKRIGIIGWILFLALVYFPLFLHLDSYPFKIWDESLFAMRAYHIAVEGSILENFSYFSHIIEHANLKPPLGSLFQALSFQLLGYNELGLRIPIALFALATSFLMIRLGKEVLNSYLPGALGTLILLTSTGYICTHVARTGDQDVMLAFWSFASMYAFYLYIHSSAFRQKFLWIMVACLVAGFLTKTVLAFFFLPGFFIYALIQRKLKGILQQKQVYAAIGILGVVVLGYYLLMNFLFDDFWKQVSEFVLSRYMGERNDQGQYFFYYFKQLITAEFLPWVILLPINLFLYYRSKQAAFRNISLLLWLCMLSNLILVSFSATRMSWYEAAAYPPAAMLAGVTLYQLLSLKRYHWTVLAPALLIFSWAYYRIIYKVTNYHITQPDEKIAYLMKKVKKELPELKHYTIYCQSHNSQVAFYSKMYNDQHDYDIRVMTFWDEEKVGIGNYLMLFNDQQLARSKEEHELELISAYDEVQLYLLK